MLLPRRRFGALAATLAAAPVLSGYLGESSNVSVRFDADDVRVVAPTGQLRSVSAAPTVAVGWDDLTPVEATTTLSVKPAGHLLWTAVGTSSHALPPAATEARLSLPRCDLFDADGGTRLPPVAAFDADGSDERTTSCRLRLRVALFGRDGDRLARGDATTAFAVTVVRGETDTAAADSQAPDAREGGAETTASANVVAVPADGRSFPTPIQTLTFEEPPRFGWLWNREPRWSYADLQPKEHLRLVAGGDTCCGRALRVALNEGNHKGCIADFQFADVVGHSLERAHARYMVRFSEDFEVINAGGKLPGFGGKYGCGSGGDGPCDGTDGWSARNGFDRPERHGFEEDVGKIQLAYYLYHADMEGRFGNKDPWGLNDNAGAVERDRWYRLDCAVEMNTPGENDGVLRGWVDGTLAYERANLKFRAAGYDHIKVKSWLHEVYYGGGWPSPRDQAVFVDDVELYDRPVRPTAAGVRTG